MNNHWELNTCPWGNFRIWNFTAIVGKCWMCSFKWIPWNDNSPGEVLVVFNLRLYYLELYLKIIFLIFQMLFNQNTNSYIMKHGQLNTGKLGRLGTDAFCMPLFAGGSLTWSHSAAVTKEDRSVEQGVSRCLLLASATGSITETVLWDTSPSSPVPALAARCVEFQYWNAGSEPPIKE